MRLSLQTGRHSTFMANAYSCETCHWFELKLQMSHHPLLRRYYYHVTNAVYDTTLSGIQWHKAESKAICSIECLYHYCCSYFWRERQHKPASISIQSLPVPQLPPLLVALCGQCDTQNCLKFKRRRHEIHAICPCPTSHSYILKIPTFSSPSGGNACCQSLLLPP